MGEEPETLTRKAFFFVNVYDSHRVAMVLKQDVPNLGFRGEEVSVKAGYARNFLYPEKLAVYATPTNLEKFKVNKESVDEVEAERERAYKQVITRITSVELVFKRHTAARGETTLHSSVTCVLLLL